jgi:hypothetical protein
MGRGPVRRPLILLLIAAGVMMAASAFADDVVWHRIPKFGFSDLAPRRGAGLRALIGDFRLRAGLNSGAGGGFLEAFIARSTNSRIWDEVLAQGWMLLLT